ncbi:MAG TPA: PAS domain-containing protein, partial [Blastocatellia bacterium]|nr:PAS domain-containing protein [Blastocatellia bacterium]
MRSSESHSSLIHLLALLLHVGRVSTSSGMEYAADYASVVNMYEIPRHQTSSGILTSEERAVKEQSPNIGFDLAGENERMGRLNQQLSRINEDILGVFDALPTGVMAVDADERVSLLNRTAEQLLLLPREAIIDRRWDQVLPIKEQSKEMLRNLSRLPLHDRPKLPVQILTGEQGCWVEIEARENPAKPGEK